MLEYAECHILTTHDILTRIQGCKYATVINLNMDYMALHLDAHTKTILCIILHFGIYKCQVLLMVLKPATYLLQSQMIQIYAPVKERSP